MYSLVYRDCKGISLTRRPNVKLYPDTYTLEGEREARTMADVAWKIGEILNSGRPVILSGLCIERDGAGNCTSEHVVVISGVKELCEGSGKNCKKVLKVQNSWGTEWHRKYGEWFDQDVLLKNVSRQNPLQRGALSWYE